MLVNDITPSGEMGTWELRETFESFLYELFLSFHWFVNAKKKSHYKIANSHLLLSLYGFNDINNCTVYISPPPNPLPSGEGESVTVDESITSDIK